ncbi:hypothetical protein C8J57DRAFT_1242923 [Mycena rebaudengoi]|nr:hypothetical protein C8J57DRAFT_1242923 [Mycena rebaudengoi]
MVWDRGVDTGSGSESLACAPGLGTRVKRGREREMAARRSGERERERMGAGGPKDSQFSPWFDIFSTEFVDGHGLPGGDFFLFHGVMLGITVEDVAVPSNCVEAAHECRMQHITELPSDDVLGQCGSLYCSKSCVGLVVTIAQPVGAIFNLLQTRDDVVIVTLVRCLLSIIRRDVRLEAEASKGGGVQVREGVWGLVGGLGGVCAMGAAATGARAAVVILGELLERVTVADRIVDAGPMSERSVFWGRRWLGPAPRQWSEAFLLVGGTRSGLASSGAVEAAIASSSAAALASF